MKPTNVKDNLKDSSTNLKPWNSPSVKIWPIKSITLGGAGGSEHTTSSSAAAGS